MKSKELLSILDKYKLTKEQIETLESFKKNQLSVFLNIINKSEIRYLDAVIVILKKNETINEKQISILNEASNNDLAITLANFLADKKCAIGNDNKLSLAEHIVSIKDTETAIGALNTIWQLAEAGITRNNEEKYIDLGKIMTKFSHANDLVYVKNFLYTIYPKACFRQLIEEDVLETKDIEKDIIELMSKCPSEKMPYLNNLLSGLMISTKITKNNYDYFINTVNKAINTKDSKLLELAGETSHLFCVVKENRQLNYVNAILNSESIIGAKFSFKILKNATSYLNDTVYETPELLKLVRIIGRFDTSDIHNWFGKKLCQNINAHNIPAALYLIKNHSGADINLMNHVLDILEDEDNYVLFADLYEEDEDAAIHGLKRLTESFPNMEFSINKTYVKKTNKVTEE